MPQPVYTPLGVRLLYTPHWPHPPQEAFLWLDCLDAFYGGSAGPGKSWSLLAAALQYVDVPGYSAICCSARRSKISTSPGRLSLAARNG
jgi:hypothetical protein